MIGLLNAYYLDKSAAYQKAYTDLFLHYFQDLFGSENVRLYNVALGELPQKVDECTAWIISGSSKSAYENEPWIQKLIHFVQLAAQTNCKIIGICFGHQLIALALGGRTEKFAGGWGLGVQTFSIVRKQQWMKPAISSCQLLFSHQDQVMKLPPGGTILAENKHCHIQMFSISNQVLGIQGHPEFTAEFANSRMESRRNQIPPDTLANAQATLKQSTDSRTIGQWIYNFTKDAHG